ncbi:MAG: flagellar biosynthesis protein FlhB, partial [Armatimonadota bacterium]|nr:flagellar biosynthesis protein FlhB [Armatimonadota bacterium]
MALEDRTEAPTPRRRQEARQEGQVARSIELNSALILLFALLIVKLCAPWSADRLRRIMLDSFTHFPTGDLSPGDVVDKLVRVLLEASAVIAPLVLGVAVVGFVSCALQVGFAVSGKPLQPRWDRLNPVAGLGRMFSVRAGVECLKGVAKVLIVGYIVYSFIRRRQAEIAVLAGAHYLVGLKTVGRLTWELLLNAALAILVMAGLDYMFQRWQHEKQLRMTKQEVKDDLKRTEGDPLVKSRIRQRQRAIAQRRMMYEVPKADVVVTNPTHYAVALKYEPEKYNAPIVVAKGQRLLALKIREIAEQNNVPIVENPSLARTLYATVEVGDEIPAQLYQAVAEILAYVYHLSHKVA